MFTLTARIKYYFCCQLILLFLSGVLTKIGGVRKFRKISDIEGVIKDADAAFGDAIEASKNKKTPGCKYIF